MKTWLWAFAVLLGIASCSCASESTGFTIGADHLRIHYLKSGPSRAPYTLLLIPGWRISASIWSEQLRHFAARGDRVVAIDSRSQGESSIAPSGNAPENRAADINQVIHSLQLDHVILIGWSQGAQDVAAYANQFGISALDGMVLVDSPVSAGPDDVSQNPGFIKVIESGIGVYARNPEAYSAGMLHAIMHVPPPASSYALLEAEAMKTPVDTGISMLVQDLFTTDRRPYLKKFNTSVLVIASGESPLLQAQRQMASVLPQAQFDVIEHAAHAVFVDQPDKFDRQLDAFIASLTAMHSARD
jgi:microsomal epoxide hydrolase